jgi:hypothetical protein
VSRRRPNGMLLAGAVPVFVGTIFVTLFGISPGFGLLQTRDQGQGWGRLSPRARACAAARLA